MPRIVKTIKDNKGNNLEVYSDNCIRCLKEMVFPKADSDRIEQMFPFLKERLENGTTCVECAVEDEKSGKFIFSDEEINMIKATAMKEK